MSVKAIHVLVCTYQGEQFIAKQLDSILQQSYSLVEVHVHDDCSTDDTQEIVKRYCNNHNNVHLYINHKNIGFLKNFENAIKVCTGNYIALSDQDDIWHIDKLTLSMEAMKVLESKNPEIPALVHSDLSFINEDGSWFEPSFFQKKGIDLSDKKSLSAILGHCGVMGNTTLMNRLLAEKALPFPDNLKYHDYWLAVINELFGVRKTLNSSLVDYRIHVNNSSANNRSLNLVHKSSLYKRDFPLPFMDDSREYALDYLIKNYQLTDEEYNLISKFKDYLIFNGSRFKSFIFLYRNGFLKNKLLFRLTVLYRILLTKRYDK